MIRDLAHTDFTLAHTKRRTPLRLCIFPCVMVILFCALLMQAWTGDRGLKNWLQSKEIYAQRVADLERIKNNNQDLRGRIERLQLSTLDLDYLEERARADLGMVAPDESVIFVDPTVKPTD